MIILPGTRPLLSYGGILDLKNETTCWPAVAAPYPSLGHSAPPNPRPDSVFTYMTR